MNSPHWILTEDEFMKPSYRISPFSTINISENGQIDASDNVDRYFKKLFPEYHVSYVQKARNAITLILENLNLRYDDVVSILTTTQNIYVSGCVTKAIEKVCQWNREISQNTKVIVVIHEFGTIYRDMDKLYSLGLPIIEDFAHSFNSFGGGCGRSDHLVFSFPKYFPIQYGGVVLSKKYPSFNEKITVEQIAYIKNVISYHIDKIDLYREKRIINYNYLKAAFLKLGCEERFIFTEYETPSVFMFKVSSNIDLSMLKSHFQKNGVESSVFYGELAFFVPVHHVLQYEDLDYFIFVYQQFIFRCDGRDDES